MPADSCPVERVPGVGELPGVRAAFLGRAPGVEVRTDRSTALERLEGIHRSVADREGFSGIPFSRVEQVHDNKVAIITALGESPLPGFDGMITGSPRICLAVYVADCAAVYLADRHNRAVGLLHSGSKGTRLKIAVVAVRLMQSQLGVEPEDLVAAISPCIRPPHYEWDFAAAIRDQLAGEGVGEIHDARICTAADPQRYYSYRREKGRTGRMLALLAIDTPRVGSEPDVTSH